MVNGIFSLQPKACTFVFWQFTSLAIVSNMGTRSSSSSARRETSSAKSSEGCLAKRHTNRARFNSPVQQPIHACGKWVRGQHTALANTSLILNHELWVPVRTQLIELSYSTLKSLTILSGIPSLVRSSHNAGQLRESNGSRRSTNAAKDGWPKSCLHCAVVHKVAMRSHVERPCVNPLCWGCLCDNNVGLILARMICSNTLPGTESSYPSIIATLRLGSFSFIRTVPVQLIIKKRCHVFLEQQRHSKTELNQTRSKPTTVDQPVRTAHTFVHHCNSTQYCNRDSFF